MPTLSLPLAASLPWALPGALPPVGTADSPCNEDATVCSYVFDHTTRGGVAQVADWLVGKPLALLGFLLAGLLLRWVLHRLIDRVVLRAEGGVLPAGVPGRWKKSGTGTPGQAAAASTRRVQRAKTIGDLFKSIVTGVLVAIVGTMMLSEVGVNIAPIIASAGIIGVALGFGAQSLVKDFLTGVFMIVEDQYGVGDVVNVGEATGTIEAVTLRVTRLRSIDGTVWYVPNGEITRVGNLSQNWSRALVDVGVAYDSDVARVKEVLAEVGHSMWEDEDFRGYLIEEPEVTGVESLSADSIDIRVMVKTVPLQNWKVARELRQRIKSRFDQEGIEIPFAQRVVWHREDTAERPAGGPSSPTTGDPAGTMIG